MSNSADEYEDEGEEVEMEEETRRQKKKRRSTTASGVGETSSSKTPVSCGHRISQYSIFLRYIKL